MTKSQWSSGHEPVKRNPIPAATSGADPIATGLQQLFAPLAAEPIPDEFMALLDRIDANARTADAAGRLGAPDQAMQTGIEAAK